MSFKSYRDHSKTNWGNQSGTANLEQINCGSLLRIADAVEKMALRYTELIDQKERSDRSAKYLRETCDKRDRQLSAAKGQITKLRNAAKKMAEINAAFEAAKGAT